MSMTDACIWAYNSAKLCPPAEGEGGHIAFGADPVGVGVDSCLHSICVQIHITIFGMTIWDTSWENLFLSYANNKDTDQPAHPRSLISVFAIRGLDSMMPDATLSIGPSLCSMTNGVWA